MARHVHYYLTCDICGAEMDHLPPHNPRTVLNAKQEFDLNPGIYLKWEELCAGCNEWLDKKVYELWDQATEMKRKK